MQSSDNALLRQLIASVLTEDLETFLDRASHIRYDSTWGNDNTTFAGPDFVFQKKMSREIKQIWNEEADHEFFKTLTKIYWISRPINSIRRTVHRMLQPGSGKDEISVGLYAPSDRKTSSWASIGLEVQGHVTLAANDMDMLNSGYSDIPTALRKSFKSSGVPKRPGFINSDMKQYYILDAGSFKASNDYDNEGIVDNWKPVAIRIEYTSGQQLNNIVKRTAVQLARFSGLPLISADDKILFDG